MKRRRPKPGAISPTIKEEARHDAQILAKEISTLIHTHWNAKQFVVQSPSSSYSPSNSSSYPSAAVQPAINKNKNKNKNKNPHETNTSSNTSTTQRTITRGTITSIHQGDHNNIIHTHNNNSNIQNHHYSSTTNHHNRQRQREPQQELNLEERGVASSVYRAVARGSSFAENAPLDEDDDLLPPIQEHDFQKENNASGINGSIGSRSSSSTNHVPIDNNRKKGIQKVGKRPPNSPNHTNTTTAITTLHSKQTNQLVQTKPKTKKKFPFKGNYTKKTKFPTSTTTNPELNTPGQIRKQLKKTKKATKDASMCALCGNVFSTEYHATVHELRCVHSMIMGMMTLTKQQRYKLQRRLQPPLSPGVETQSIYHNKQRYPQHHNSDIDSQLAPSYSNYYSSSISRNNDGIINLSNQAKRLMVMTDEPLLRIVQSFRGFLCTPAQTNAQRELALMARDRSFYDMLFLRSIQRKYAHNHHNNKHNNKKNAKSGFFHSVKNKLSKTYTLIKEGEEQVTLRGKYNVNNRGRHITEPIKHDDDTMYINVAVKSSVQAVNNELVKQAKKIWDYEKTEYKNQFERIRAMAQLHVVKFAQLALATDLKPGRIAVQLSNDLDRYLSNQLRRFGVEVESEIEHQKGRFFILGVNILSIDWIIIMKHFNFVASQRRDAWTDGGEDTETNKNAVDDGGNATVIFPFHPRFRRIFQFTIFEIFEQALAWLYHVHWSISVPLCSLLYHYCFRTKLKRFIITSVTEDFFQYVEKEGVEMGLDIQEARSQTAFMFEAMRQMEKEARDLKKKKAEAAGEEVVSLTRGPLLGPAIEMDKEVPTIPEGFSVPENLETVNFEYDFPVGFRRLRYALLHNKSFTEEAIMMDGLNQTNIEYGEWDHHQGIIGLHETPEENDEKDFIGAKLSCQYLMPKSVFVKANMVYEEVELIAYNDYCFAKKQETRTPDVPYGKTFVSKSQMVVINTGNDSCRMISSVEAEFPNGPPMVKRQILSGLRAGSAAVMVKLGAVICRYANEFPPEK